MMMKKTTIAVLSAALLFGGMLHIPAAHAAAQNEAAQSDANSAIHFKLNPGIKKQYGEAAFELETLAASPKETEFTISRIVPENINEEIDRNIMKMNYIVMDNNGWIYDRIQAKEQWRENPDGVLARVFTEKVEAFRGKPKELILKPYIGGDYDDKSTALAQKANVAARLTGKFPLVLDQGKIGSVSVTGVDFQKDKTVLSLSAKGETASLQIQATWLMQNGKSLQCASKKLIGVDQDVYRYQMEFPAVNRKAQLEVMTKRMTPVTFLNELEMRVNLP
ncbi:DUF5643 domain-containing protein [Paenibacillus azoreducens]|nr:DUF5643 domain-containing protein [Paenibacillus azoreducens]